MSLPGRPGKLQNYMDIAEVVARRSHDADTKVGAILVKNGSGAIIATGFNGFARGADDEKLPNNRPDKYQYIIHAETNIVAHCARHGISMEDCMLVCTLTPCVSCMRLLWQCGITEVIAKDLYRDIEAIQKMKDIAIVLLKTVEGFHALTYAEA